LLDNFYFGSTATARDVGDMASLIFSVPVLLNGPFAVLALRLQAVWSRFISVEVCNTL
jgi:hypothetical protein